MGKLGIQVEDYPEQVNEPGQYTIKDVKTKQKTRFGIADILTVANAKGERSLFVQHSDQTTSRTNLGRLVKAFTDDPDRWIGKKIHVTIGEDGKRTLEPVVK
jgi:hypothetical protein